LSYDLKKWHVSLAKLNGLIQNCNNVIMIFDTLEEYRPLVCAEFNFRKVVKLHLQDLLKCESDYWKKRCTIRWIEQGEENSKFFHAMATERYRRNNIAMLRDETGAEFSDHQTMAGMLWTNYKERMGRSKGISMQFDLGHLIQRVDGLEELTAPFTKEEMNGVIKNMPTDRAPEPDGFNGRFLKKCWPIIQTEFYRLAEEFNDGNLKLQNINGSYITLVPKVACPVGVDDFRPISLTNVCLKFLTKLAANRLQGRILECVSKNQYGFLRKRSIQDRLAWSFEYIYLCHASKKPIVILKLDFAKAFDTIEHEVIIQVMQHEKWIVWIREILSSGTSVILLNGVLGKQFACKRGFGKAILSRLYYLSLARICYRWW
jgi:hypothetical protein